MRGSGPVSRRSREKVERAVRELGFRPSQLGVSLAQGKHAANGIVFPDLSGPYYAEVVIGYEETASRLGRSVLIFSTRGRNDIGRYTGLRAGLRAQGLPCRAPMRCALTDEAGCHAVHELLKQERPDALVCANDEVALGALQAAAEVGLRVPVDVPVTGWTT